MVVVTGGAGFIGSAVIEKLNSEGINDIIVVDHLGEDEKWKNLVNLSYEDYMDRDEFLELVFDGDLGKEINCVIHMGACSSTTEKDSNYLMYNNYKYTRHLIEWSLENNIHFIYASSAATYGNGEFGFRDDYLTTEQLQPQNMYGYSKHMLDKWAIKNNLIDGIVGLKFFNVFGPNEYHKGYMRSVVHKAYEQILETGEMKLFKSDHPDYEDGCQMRDFVYVKDVANVIWWLFINRDVTGLFNLGTGKARTWLDLVKAVFDSMQKNANITFIDMPDKLKGKYQYYTQADMTKLLSAGYDLPFFSLEDAVFDYIRNYLMTTNKYL